MTPGVKPLVAGNWKMNGTGAALGEVRAIVEGLSASGSAVADAMLCVPATLIGRAADAAGGAVLEIGGQDCHAKESGAHTGDVSAEMLRDAGASAVIVGHSERRTDHGETDATVRDKAAAAWRAGVTAIICVGETREQRENGEAERVTSAQLDGSIPDDMTAGNTVIAYEPVWAIGTGLVPSNDDIAAIHALIRDRMEARFGGEGRKVRILYGGSVKSGNAAEIFAIDNVDGGLIGGASLKAADFLAICDAVPD
ncbi:triose-phosphate isomerase [Oricola cellulosilytica]|uniref:Triosephosphate isomerase n=1 Tax=Oricola cellulosilytica TaxID=1429082 RepID=A0A4R0P8N3_9HYPH|nr:triose-phosphate isomerase [Oricola cellulosilytica]TCD13195.1 triose-phosphate isomerase [Oricola cellulosilytica]